MGGKTGKMAPCQPSQVPGKRHTSPSLGRGGMIFILLFLLFITLAVVGCASDPFRVQEDPPQAEGLDPGDLFARSRGDIHHYMPDLLAGKDVSGYDLLPCLENFTPSTWADLDDNYGREWWNPLWTALRASAVGGERTPCDYEEQAWRNYYLGRAFLAADGAYSQGIMDIVLLQWDYDPALYSSSLVKYFPAEEETTLRQFLTYGLIFFNDDVFGLYPGDASTGGTLYLGSYPIDFPFSFDLAEKSREDFRAESFGPGTIVESEGLEVNYLQPSEGVYTVITIRTVQKGYSIGGVAIGDPEAILWEQWQDKPLRKLDSLSYDDESWFGDQYDYAYSYTQGEGTKSAVFLMKDGIICGLELIDGLDGAIY